jgi:hypothetical protein
VKSLSLPRRENASLCFEHQKYKFGLIINKKIKEVLKGAIFIMIMTLIASYKILNLMKEKKIIKN